MIVAAVFLWKPLTVLLHSVVQRTTVVQQMEIEHPFENQSNASQNYVLPFQTLIVRLRYMQSKPSKDGGASTQDTVLKDKQMIHWRMFSDVLRNSVGC